MALQDVKAEINSFVLTIKNGKHSHQIKQVLFALLAAGVLGGAYVAYRWYRVGQEQRAQKIFSEYLTDYRAALQSENPDWQIMAQKFAEGAKAQSSSVLAPYFFVVQSQVLLQDNKKDDALTAMNKAIDGMQKGTPLYRLYKTRRALMRMDHDDASIVQKGLDELTELAQDTKNTQADVALFYLGRYHWAQDNIDEAKVAWKDLVTRFLHTGVSPSPWAQEAQDKLQQLGA